MSNMILPLIIYHMIVFSDVPTEKPTVTTTVIPE